MAGYVQIFLLVIAGILLIWFGYTLLFVLGKGGPSSRRERPSRSWAEPGTEPAKESWKRHPGGSQTCPVCSALLSGGELINSSAFPSFNGKERIMHIRGCPYCLSGERDRICPVCGARLTASEILVCRMFERSFRRPHVHVMGCSRCRNTL